MDTAALRQCFPQLSRDPVFFEQLQKQARVQDFPAQQAICDEGHYCQHLALVVKGSARVYKLSEHGKEITLYHVTAGDCCILTLSCIISQNRFPAFAITDTYVEALIVNAHTIRQWTEEYPTWRRYAWNLIAKRFADVISLVEEITFKRMDERLAVYLSQRQHFPIGHEIPITHQRIAAELGSSREVISRLLKDLEQKGLVKIGRGWLKVLKPPCDWHKD